MALRESRHVSDHDTLRRFSAAGFLDESTELSAVVKACGAQVRAGLPKEGQVEQEQTGLCPGEDRAK